MSEGKLPNGWMLKTIKEIVKYKKGKKPKILADEEFENSIPYLDIKALELGEVRRYADYESSNLLDANSIAIVWDGARSGWVSKGQFGAIGSTIAALTPILVDVDYTYHFLRSQFEKLNNNTRGTGIPHVNPDVLWNIQIPIPPLPEQKRIVARLDAIFGHLDVLREKLDRIPEFLKNFRQQVLTQAVTGELTKEWREGKGFGEWEYEKAENCCFKVQSGGTPKSDGFAETGIPFLKVYNIVNNKVDFDYKPQFVTPEAHATKIKKSILLPGDVLMNIVGPPLNKIVPMI